MSDVSLENEIEVKEEVINDVEEKKDVVTPEDYKLIRDMMKDMDEWNATLPVHHNCSFLVQVRLSLIPI